MLDDLKRIHSNKEKLGKGAGKNMWNSDQKIKLLMESPEHAAIRMARNAATLVIFMLLKSVTASLKTIVNFYDVFQPFRYSKLFERHQKTKPPIWQSTHAESFSDDLNGNG